MKIILNWIIGALCILAVAYLLPGVTVTGFFAALVVALVLGLINAFIRPVVVILTLPLNIATIGLFTIVINTLMIMVAAALVPGFSIASFWWALVFSVILSVVNMFFRGEEAPIYKIA